ncbi:midnolin homolog isoform X2 [Anopheles stephensi]|uniref:midnolin homolog isoform X2 n=1 Tax=Anopheles stephensi TaxID=30069 RepID=UPI001658926D|nr:midnolin homolog isoform X2 [Anopheles stephensi]
MPGLFPSSIDGHDSGTESDGDLEQEDDLIQEHEMELSLSSRQDTVSPTDTACSSESPAFLGPSSSHLLLYDQNSSEEELEVINGGAGDVGSCAIEVGSVSGVPSRMSGGITGMLPIMNPHADDDDEDEEEEEEEEEEEDDATEDIVEDDVDEDRDYASPATATTPTAMGSTAATIIESVTGGGAGAMDTSSSTPSSNSGSSIVRGGQFMAIGGACDDSGAEPLDDFAEELSSLTAVPSVPLTPSSATKLISTGAGKRLGSVSSLLEKRKRSLAHNSDDEVRYLLEQQQPTQQQQQQQKQQQQTLHSLSHQYHHHHHHSLRQPHHHHHHPEQQLHHHHQDELQPEETPLSAPVNFRTSPPLEALKPHRGHIMQRSTTPLVLSEGSGAAPTNGLLPSAGSSLLSSAASSLSSLSGTGISGFYGPGSSSSNNNNSNGVNGGSGGGGGGGAGGLRFGLVRRTIGCDSPLTAVCHRNSTNPPPHGGGASSLGSGLSTTTRTSSSSTPSSLSSAPASLVRLVAGTGSSPEPCGVGPTLVTNMDISRSVSPPAKMFHCAVSPRRRQSRHQQQRLQRPHRPCLDFDKMQQLKARSVTTWRHSNEHSGELSVFCW